MEKECRICEVEYDLDADAVLIDTSTGKACCPMCNTPLTSVVNMYYKIFKDRLSMDNYFVVDKYELEVIVCDTRECGDELYPVFEPVLMSKEEFLELPEFEGF